MTLSLTKPNYQQSQGFTLLEMLVVILLVSLLASLLMQGFVYMSGTYYAVERRQLRAQQEELLEGWLRDSIHGVINGVDGELSKNNQFSGDSTSFSGMSLGSLAGQPQGTPIKIIWSIEQKDGLILLRYGEAPLSGGPMIWYTLKEWPGTVSASWQYLHDGQWLTNFPPQTSIFARNKKTALPRAISLHVNSVPVPIELIISVRSNPNIYMPPRIEGVL
jgi:general secretion pathway protein J